MRHIIIGFIITVISFLLLKHNFWLVEQTGTWGWAERVLGSEGGTRLVLKLLALLGVIIGLLTVVGLHDQFIRWLLIPLFGAR